MGVSDRYNRNDRSGAPGPTANLARRSRYRPPETQGAPGTLITASYWNGAGGTITSGVSTRLLFPTKLWDTHNVVTTGASWVITSPIVGYLDLRCCAMLDNSMAYAVTKYVRLMSVKDGSEYKGLFYLDGRSSDGDNIKGAVFGGCRVNVNVGTQVYVILTQDTGGDRTLLSGTAWNWIELDFVRDR